MKPRTRKIWTPLTSMALPVAILVALQPQGSADAASLSDAAARLPAGKFATLDGVNRIDGLKVVESEDGTTTLVLSGTKEATFNVYRLDAPDRLVLDISAAEAGKVVPYISADTWAVGRVDLGVVTEGGGRLLRMTIDLKRDSSYLVVPAGRELNITVTPHDVPPEAYFARKSAAERRTEIEQLQADARTAKDQASAAVTKAQARASMLEVEAKKAEARLRDAEKALELVQKEGRKSRRRSTRVKEQEAIVAQATGEAKRARAEAKRALTRAEEIRHEAQEEARAVRTVARREAADMRAQAERHRAAAARLREEAESSKRAANKKEAAALQRMKQLEARAAELSALEAEAKAAALDARSSKNEAHAAREEAVRLQQVAARATDEATQARAIAKAEAAEAAALKAEARAMQDEAARMRTEAQAARADSERLLSEARALKDKSAKEALALRADVEAQKAAALAARAEAEQLRAEAMTYRKTARRDREEAERERTASRAYASKQKESANAMLGAAEKALSSAAKDREEAQRRAAEANRVLADAKARVEKSSRSQRAEYERLLTQAKTAERAAHDRVAAAERRMTALQNSQRSLQEAVSSQESRQEELVREIEKKEREIATLDGRKRQAEEALRSSQEGTEHAKRRQSKQSKELDAKLERQAQELRAVEARLKQVRGALATKTADLEALDQRVNEAQDQVASAIERDAPSRSVASDWKQARDGLAVSKIKDVRFEDGPDASRVIIDVDGPLVYSGSNLTPTMKLLSLEGAQIPEGLERSLDASGFGGPVRTVTSFREGDVVKVIVAMQEDSTPRLEERPGQLVLNFPRSKARAGTTPVHKQVVSVASQQVAGFASAPAAMATSSKSSRRRKKWRGERIDLELQDAAIKDVLLIFSDVGRVNIIAGDGVDGQVTMRLTSVPWDQALDIILRSLRLGMVQEGNIVRIATLATLEEERQEAIDRANAQVKLKPLETRLIPLSYATVGEMAPKVGSVLSSRGQVTPDTRTNTLIVMDVVENIAIAEQLVNKLDSQTPQVTIEARIVEARTNWLRELGIQWGFDFIASPGTGNPTGLWFPNALGVAGGSGSVGQIPLTEGLLLPAAAQSPNYVVDLPAAAGTGTGGAVGFSFGSVDGNLNTNLRLSAAEDVGEVRIISAPKISTLDNTTASIEQGVQIPISQVSAQGVNTRYVNATLGLSVTPHVTNEGSVLLTVDVQKNEADFVNVGARGDPTILTKSASSQMLVQDGDTAVIGGIFTRNQSVNRKKIPWIADIPIIGWFFKSKREADTRTEVLIFLTPKIINRSTSIGG